MTTHLPLQLTSFIGRRQEVDRVARLLENARLLTVTGPGGVGKTRLAIEVARQAPADDVWFVELAPVVDGRLIVSTMASALGVADVSNEPLLDTLMRFLRDRPALLVLDNCEHVIAAVAAIAKHLLAACPRLTLLATSRESLNIAGEAVQRLAPLAVSESVALLLDRATAAGCPVGTGEQKQDAMADVCRQLDGLPLAIELAAPYLCLFSVQELAARLNQHFELLESRERGAAPRHQTLRAMVDWSHELLTDDEQCLYRRLSVFAGGCTFEAVEGICADALLPASAVLPALRGLVEKSLVVADEQDGGMRYHMLESLRQHARERLVAADEEYRLRHRHLAWFRGMAELAEAAFQGDEPLRWQRQVRREIENLRSALARGKSEPEEAEAGLALAAAIPRYWSTNDFGSEACDWLRALLAIVPSPAMRAKGLDALGWLETRRGNPSAEFVLQESVAIARTLDDPSRLCIGLKDLGFALLEKGELAQAREALEEALELRHTRASLPWNYSILEYLGRTMAALGDFQTGIAQLTQAVAEAREQDDPFTLGFILRDLGTVLLDFGDLPAARTALEESLDLRVGRLQVSRTLVCFAGLAAAEGEPLRAFRLAGAATSLRAASHERMPLTADAELDRWLRNARHAVDPESRDAAWAEGAAMSMDEALACARESSRHPAEPVRLHEQPGAGILTPREREVVHLVARGSTNRQIAAALVISERTVARHVENVLGKLSLASRVQVAAWAIDHGIARAGQHRTA